MSEWTRIQRGFEATLVLDRKAELREERAARSRRALAEWLVRAEEAVLGRLLGSLERRVAELRRLGANVEVEPARPPGSANLVVGSRRFVRVCYGADEVVVYSTRSEVNLTVHWAWALKRKGARFARILSVPGFRVRRGHNAELLLERDVEGEPSPVRIEDVACTILGMLADAARTRATRRGFRE